MIIVDLATAPLAAWLREAFPATAGATSECPDFLCDNHGTVTCVCMEESDDGEPLDDCDLCDGVGAYPCPDSCGGAAEQVAVVLGVPLWKSDLKRRLARLHKKLVVRVRADADDGLLWMGPFPPLVRAASIERRTIREAYPHDMQTPLRFAARRAAA